MKKELKILAIETSCDPTSVTAATFVRGETRQDYINHSMKQSVKILAIETSCDETAAAVIGEETIFGSQTPTTPNPSSGMRGTLKFGMTGLRPVVLSNIISSQIDLHAKTGGVVPEVASREHMKSIIPVVSEALLKSHSGVILNISEESSSNATLDPSAEPQDDNLNYQQAIKILRDEIDYIAVTNGPGLIGSLLVGFNAAKTIAYARDLPIISINHIEGHIYSAIGGGNTKLETRNSKQIPNSNFENSKLVSDFDIGASIFPLIALTVSGGHTSLTLMEDHGTYEQIGATLDDAVGEAYDKVAKLLGLGYPGGPALSRLASEFRKSVERRKRNVESAEPSTLHPLRSTGIVFPRPIIDDGSFNFSFSGLKTAVLVWVKKYLEANRLDSTEKIPLEVKKEIAVAFEEAVKDVLAAKTLKAIEKYKPKAVIFAGGVSANEYLRSQIESAVNCKLSTVNFFVPDKDMCGDNAAMIGLAAYYHIKRGDIKNWNEIRVDSNLEL